jgi:hypothetical protein
VSFQRRGCLDRIANTVIFHLKRFELDYNTFQNKKVNQRYVFPEHIDLAPYTKAGVAAADQAKKTSRSSSSSSSSSSLSSSTAGETDAAAASASAVSTSSEAATTSGNGDDVEVDVDVTSEMTLNAEAKEKEKEKAKAKDGSVYALVGVLVHTGNAQAGHYYSFVKERGGVGASSGGGGGNSAKHKDASAGSGNGGGGNNGGGNSSGGNGNGSWIEFNDHLTRPFSSRHIDEECFGGTTQNSDRMRNACT